MVTRPCILILRMLLSGIGVSYTNFEPVYPYPSPANISPTLIQLVVTLARKTSLAWIGLRCLSSQYLGSF